MSAEETPFEIRASLVRSLYSGERELVVGMLVQLIIVGLGYFESGYPIYLVIASAILAIGLWRFREVRYYNSQMRSLATEASLRYWENRYAINAVFAGLTLGFYVYVGLYLYPTVYSQQAAAIVAGASLASIVGRLYASRKLVLMMTLALLLPFLAAQLHTGDIYHFVAALLVAPFGFVVIGSAATVRQHLSEAVRSRTEATKLAKQLDVALNTMPHALVMFGSDMKIEVANAKASSLFFGNSPKVVRGRNVLGVIRSFSSAGLISQRDADKLKGMVDAIAHSQGVRKAQITVSGDRHFEFTVRARDDRVGGVVIFEDVSDRIVAQQKINHMARYDALTGLPNRREIASVISAETPKIPASRIAAAYLFDVNDFKHINDTFGHPFGDAILKEIGNRLSALASSTIQVGRLGGDEFMVFAKDFTDLKGVQKFAEDLTDTLCGQYTVNGVSTAVSISIGFVSPLVAADRFDDILIRTDLALYEAKASPARNWMMFHESMNVRYRERQQMKEDLRAAIENGDINVIYQPILAADSLRLVSCEALARWSHPVNGPISPTVFIPIAEETGLISVLSRQMLRRACRDCATWASEVCVSVNLSARDFLHTDVVAMVSEALRESGLAPERLELEVTESLVINDTERARRVLWELSAIGVKLALDDFGTGYSNLSYLHELPLNRIKIDRSFVASVTRNKRALQLLRGVTSLAKEMNLFITLEGIETVEQLELIGITGNVDRLQGFLFGASLASDLVGQLGNAAWGRTDREWVINSAAAPAIEKKTVR